MAGTQLRTAGLLLAAVVVLASGLWLTRSGRPYGPLLLNIHKLVDLGALIVIGMSVYQSNRAVTLSSTEWIALGFVTLVVVATFASGGAISAMDEPPTWALRLHRVVSWIAGALAVAVAYLLARR